MSGRDLSGRRVLVIGAGAAGSAAALRLQELGASVEVLEADEEPGGRARTDRVGLWRFDRGAEFVASFYPRARALAARLGVELRPVPLRGGIVVDGRRFPLPFSPGAFLTSPLVSLPSKLRLLRITGASAFRRERLRWSFLDGAADLDDESAESFFARVVGKDYADTILKATLESLALQPIAVASRALALVQAVEAPRAALFAPRGGVGALWEEADRRLTIRCGARVVALVSRGGEVRVELESGRGLEADAAIVAVPPRAAEPLLPASSAERAVARECRTTPIVKLHVALERPFAEGEPVCPAGPGAHPLAGVAVVEAKGTGQVPDGRGALDVCASPSLSTEILAASDDEVRGRLRAEAARLLGRPVEGVIDEVVVRLAEGIPLFAVGWLRRLRDLRRELVPSRITAAGDYLASPSLEGAVQSGEEAAERLLLALRSGSRD